MIVLDANVMIALLDADDPHHADVLEVMETVVDDELAASVLTVAEALVHPSRAGVGSRALDALVSVGITTIPPADESALALADLRATTGIRMPDAVVLHAAIATGSRLATFDRTLALAARERGVGVILA